MTFSQRIKSSLTTTGELVTVWIVGILTAALLLVIAYFLVTYVFAPIMPCKVIAWMPAKDVPIRFLTISK